MIKVGLLVSTKDALQKLIDWEHEQLRSYYEAIKNPRRLNGMTRSQFIKTLDALKISQTDFARLIGVGPRTVRRWYAGDTAVPGTVRECLRAWLIMADHKLPWRDYAWEITKATEELKRIQKLARGKEDQNESVGGND